uniref:Uncharacterized protein n=1 Tax=Rhizophora mucronata TaxID=61149 RepID=A0A2P2P6Y3_RHIMU
MLWPFGSYSVSHRLGMGSMMIMANVKLGSNLDVHMTVKRSLVALL